MGSTAGSGPWAQSPGLVTAPQCSCPEVDFPAPPASAPALLGPRVLAPGRSLQHWGWEGS